jgi:hypothetical protein
MGNKSISNGEDFFEPSVSTEEAEQILRKKLDKMPYIAYILSTLQKDITDLASADLLQKNFLPLEYLTLYMNPTIEHVLSVAYNSTCKEKSKVMTDPFTSTILSKKKPRLKIKLGIVEVTDYNTPLIASEIDHTIQLPTQMNLFHSVLIVGPWKLEWNESGVIIPRKCVISNILAFDVKLFEGIEQITEKLRILSEVITEFNLLKTYDAQQCNCQHFIDTVFLQLGCPISVSGQLDAYLGKLRQTGKQPCTYTVPSNIDAIVSGEILFTSHEQLDSTVIAIREVEHMFVFHYKHDYALLQCFDHAFWLRYFLYGVENKIAHNEFKPLGYCQNNEEHKRWGDSRRSIGCPFHGILEYKYRYPV